MNVEIKIYDKRLNLDMLKPATDGSAAIDLYACIDEPITLHQGYQYKVSAGFAMHIWTPGVAGMIVPRSGLATKQGLILANTVGLIDSDYQGLIQVAVLNRKTESIGVRGKIVIEPMQRIAQLIFVPVLQPTFKQVMKFSETTERGSGGFGSTGSSITNDIKNVL